MTEEQLVYELAKEIFLKKLPVEYLHDKNIPYHELQVNNAIKVAKLFYKVVKEDESSNQSGG